MGILINTYEDGSEKIPSAITVNAASFKHEDGSEKREHIKLLIEKEFIMRYDLLEDPDVALLSAEGSAKESHVGFLIKAKKEFILQNAHSVFLGDKQPNILYEGQDVKLNGSHLHFMHVSPTDLCHGNMVMHAKNVLQIHDSNQHANGVLLIMAPTLDLQNLALRADKAVILIADHVISMDHVTIDTPNLYISSSAYQEIQQHTDVATIGLNVDVKDIGDAWSLDTNTLAYSALSWVYGEDTLYSECVDFNV